MKQRRYRQLIAGTLTLAMGWLAHPAPADWQPPSDDILQANQARVNVTEQANVVRNGSFEEGDEQRLPHWSRGFWPSPQNQTIARRAVTRTDEAAVTGRWAVRVDSSQADTTGRVFTIRQVLPLEPLRGQRVRFSVQTMLQTMPNPDGDPVTIYLRQYSPENKLIAHTRASFPHEDAYGWMNSAVEWDIRPEAGKVDMSLQFPNALANGIPGVYLVDDVRVEVVADPLLSLQLAQSELPWQRPATAHVRIGQQVPLDSLAAVTLAIEQQGKIVWHQTYTPGEHSLHLQLPTDLVGPGQYELLAVLDWPGVGPVQLIRTPVTIYVGPFDQESIDG